MRRHERVRAALDAHALRAAHPCTQIGGNARHVLRLNAGPRTIVVNDQGAAVVLGWVGEHDVIDDAVHGLLECFLASTPEDGRVGQQPGAQDAPAVNDEELGHRQEVEHVDRLDIVESRCAVDALRGHRGARGRP